MIITFRNKVFEIPAPVASQSEIIIEVEKYATFPAIKNPKEAMFRFSNSLAKFIFFLLHEGIMLTYYKVKSSYLQRNIISEKKVVFTFGRLKGREQYTIGVGPQVCPQSEYHLFPLTCTMIVEKERNINKDFCILSDYFQRNPEVFEMIYYYAPYSGGQFRFDLVRILDEWWHVCEETTSGPVAFTTPISQSAERKPIRRSRKEENAKYDLFLAGAGVYSYAYILPTMKNVRHHTIIDLNPILSSVMGEKFNFRYCDTSCERALEKLAAVENPILIIATYHSTHVPIAEKALSWNPKTIIMIEKPPATTSGQLTRLMDLRKNGCFVEIGYNRRYSQFVRMAKEILAEHEGPITMTCIVREKNIPLTHWYYWPSQGTRVTGNLSHWIDLGVFFIQKKPVSFTSISASKKFVADEPAISVLFEDGSLLNIVASDKGNSLRGIQEYIDIRRGDLTIKINDFLNMTVQEDGRQKIYRSIIRDKGHRRMYDEFMKKCSKNMSPKYPIKDLLITTSLYIEIKDALMKRQHFIELDMKNYHEISAIP